MCRLRDDPVPRRISAEFSCTVKAKLVHNAVLVKLYGAGRDIEPEGNLLNVEPLRQQLQHLALT